MSSRYYSPSFCLSFLSFEVIIRCPKYLSKRNAHSNNRLYLTPSSPSSTIFLYVTIFCVLSFSALTNSSYFLSSTSTGIVRIRTTAQGTGSDLAARMAVSLEYCKVPIRGVNIIKVMHDMMNMVKWNLSFLKVMMHSSKKPHYRFVCNEPYSMEQSSCPK